MPLSNAERQRRWRQRRQDRDRKFASLRKQINEQLKTSMADVAKSEAERAEREKERQKQNEARLAEIRKQNEELEKQHAARVRETEKRWDEVKTAIEGLERVGAQYRALYAENQKLHAAIKQLKAQVKRKAERGSRPRRYVTDYRR